jgi:chitin synthase
VFALQCSFKRSPEDHERYVLIQVPCYTEGLDSLKRTFESILLSSYKDSHKILFVTCDGNIVGSGNDFPTPQIVLHVLGVDTSIDPEPFAFQSLGEGIQQLNYAKVKYR